MVTGVLASKDSSDGDILHYLKPATQQKILVRTRPMTRTVRRAKSPRAGALELEKQHLYLS